jgi:hypothetical protein
MVHSKFFEQPTPDTVWDVGLSEESPISSNKKKQKPAPSHTSVIEESVLPDLQPNVSINQVATGVT